MYKCPGCGAELRFDIKTQKLVCDHCNTTVDPYEYKSGDEAAQSEDGTYGVNVFRCPQCGGEIVSTSTAAAEFCSYCGASVVLESRIDQKKKPDYAIPFKISKEECKKEYKKIMRRAIFTPNELRKEKYIDSFRGIYMPYWLYDVSNKGHVVYGGEKTHRKGDYLITDHYDLSCDVNAEYDGISYDSSSTFDDHTSSVIAHYKVNEMKEFTPAFLCGFYADMSDVDSSVYEPKATEIANKITKFNVESQFSGYELKARNSGDNALQTQKADRVVDAMFPVWFLSYKNGDRVAYATINGQNGIVCADMPVDEKKFFISSLILAIPLFFCIAFLQTVTAKAAMATSLVFAFTAAVIYVSTMKAITVRETHSDDMGYKSKKEFTKADMDKAREKRKKAKNKKPKKKSIFMSVLVTTAVTGIVMSIGAFLLTGSLSVIMYAIFTSIIVFMGNINRNSYEAIAESDDNALKPGEFIKGYSGIMLSSLLVTFVKMVNPVHDYYFYLASFVSMIAVMISMISIIRRHNLLATRRPPVFDRKGGDDRA